MTVTSTPTADQPSVESAPVAGHATPGSLPGPGPKPCHPPLDIVVRIGVSGHREVPEATVANIRECVRRVLGRVRAVAEGLQSTWPVPKANVVLRLISPLADGADQLVARVAVEEFGAELQSPLPARLTDYSTTFADPGWRTLTELIPRATRVLELDGKVAKSGQPPKCSSEAEASEVEGRIGEDYERQDSYSAVGRVVVENCDVLIALLDPVHKHSPGGTAEVVAEALALSRLVIWIDPSDPSEFWPLLSLRGEESRHFTQLLRYLPDKRGEALRGYSKATDEAAMGSVLTDSLSLAGVRPPTPARAHGDHSRRGQIDLLHALLAEFGRTPHVCCRWYSGRWDAWVRDWFPKSPWLETPEGGFGRITHKLYGPPVNTVKHNAGRLSSWVEKKKKSTRKDATAPAVSALLTGPQSIIQRAQDDCEKYRGPIAFLGRYYAGMYRSSVLIITLLGLLAVAMGLCGWAFSSHPHGQSPHEAKAHYFRPFLEHGWSTAELLSLSAMIVIYILFRRLHWFEKSVDFRLLAERLRHMSTFAILARSAPLYPYLPAHYGPLDPRESWVERYVRAVVRQIGIALFDPQAASAAPVNVCGVELKRRPVCFDEQYLKACKTYLRDVWLKGQVKYHEQAKAQNEIMDEMAEWVVALTLVAAIVVCIVDLKGIESRWLNFFAAFLPALATGLEAIATQSEVKRLAQRSSAMEQKLKSIMASFDSLPDESLHSAELARLSQQAAEAMLSEVGEWRVLFRTHPPSTPH